MKTSHIFCLLALISCSPLVLADQPISFPEKNPLIDLSLPDDWKIKPKGGVLYANPKDDPSFFMELSELEASIDNANAAIKEAKASIEDNFKNVTYDEKPSKADGVGVTLQVFNAKGEDADGKANINAILITQPKSEHYYMLLWISSQEAFEKHAEVGRKIIESIKAHGNAGSSESSTSEQALSMVFENNTNQDVVELYVSPNKDYSKEKNILGDTPLKSGESINVKVAKTREHCTWGVTYKSADALTSSKWDVDVCTNQHYQALGGVDAGGAKDSSGKNTGNCNWEKEGTEIAQLMEKKFGNPIHETPESNAITAGMTDALNAAVSGNIPKACDIYNDLRSKLGG
jgi:hypothetical protein